MLLPVFSCLLTNTMIMLLVNKFGELIMFLFYCGKKTCNMKYVILTIFKGTV